MIPSKFWERKSELNKGWAGAQMMGWGSLERRPRAQQTPDYLEFLPDLSTISLGLNSTANAASKRGPDWLVCVRFS